MGWLVGAVEEDLILDSLVDLLREMRVTATRNRKSGGESLDLVIEQHRGVVHAIVSRDADAAADAMSEHPEATREEYDWLRGAPGPTAREGARFVAECRVIQLNACCGLQNGWGRRRMRRLLIGLSAVALLAFAQPGGAEEPTEVVFESTGPFDTQVVWDCAGTEVGGGLAALSSGLACGGSNDLPAVVPPMAATSSTSISADGAMAASVNVSGGTPATTLAAGAWVEAGSSWSVTGQFHAVRFLVEFTSNQPFYGYDFNPVVQTGNDVARALAQTEPLQNYSDFGVGGTTGDAHGPGGPCSDGTSPRFEPTFGPPGDGSTQVQGLRVFCSDPDAVMGGPTSRTLVGAGVGTAAFARSTYLTSYDEKATGRLLKATVIIER